MHLLKYRRITVGYSLTPSNGGYDMAGGRFMIAGLAASAASVVGGYNTYADVEALRGRADSTKVESFGHYLGDVPTYIDNTFFERPSIGEMHPYEVPLERTAPWAIVALSGLSTTIVGWRELKKNKLG